MTGFQSVFNSERKARIDKELQRKQYCMMTSSCTQIWKRAVVIPPGLLLSEKCLNLLDKPDRLG